MKEKSGYVFDSLEPRAVDEEEKSKIEDHFKDNNPEAFTEDNILGAVVMAPPSFFFKQDDPEYAKFAGYVGVVLRKHKGPRGDAPAYIVEWNDADGEVYLDQQERFAADDPMAYIFLKSSLVTVLKWGEPPATTAKGASPAKGKGKKGRKGGKKQKR